ncbi:MAG: hypothetical protein K9G49_04695 [Taibaiella sp.]|nr:hypothetical protein [Taibaiella sp.]
MSERKTFEIFISIDPSDNCKKFALLNPYLQVAYCTDNIFHFYEEVTRVKEEDNGKSDFEFNDGIDLLFIEIAHVEVYAFNLLDDWTLEPEDTAPLN